MPRGPCDIVAENLPPENPSMPLLFLPLLLIMDSVLCCPDRTRDTSWLSIDGLCSIRRGKTLTTGNYGAGQVGHVQKCLIILGGNDLIQRRQDPRTGRYTHWTRPTLPAKLWTNFEQILHYWRQRSTELHYIQWGDYKSWQAGFENESPSRGRLVYDEHCRNILDFANEPFPRVQMDGITASRRSSRYKFYCKPIFIYR